MSLFPGGPRDQEINVKGRTKLHSQSGRSNSGARAPANFDGLTSGLDEKAKQDSPLALPGQFFTALFTGLIRLYQIIHLPFFKGSCRFEPTCSQYALEAIRAHGPIKGVWLGLRRMSKCHPFHKGGFDNVPPRDIQK
jgi:putative membrane protein insertion efficiency factor